MLPKSRFRSRRWRWRSLGVRAQSRLARAGSEGNRIAKATGRLIFLSVELSYFCFSVFVEDGLLSLHYLHPDPRGNREPSSRGALNSGLTSADSGLQLDLEIALNGVPAKIQPPAAIQPCRK